MQRRILFVCTGNTCRSPMAEGLARVELAQRLGCEPDRLAESGFEVASAGVSAAPGAPATPEAVQAAAEYGADLTGHRSQGATAELINSADLIFCMTDQHRTALLHLVPTAAQRTLLLSETGAIADPIGAGVDQYRRTAESIREAVLNRMSEIVQ